MAKITIIVADDHPIVRQGMRAVIGAEIDMEVVAEAEDGQQAVELSKTQSPDVVVMDVAMPVMNGLVATREILKARPGIKVLVVSSYSDSESVARLLQAGASGFLMKQTAGEELAEAIRQVRRGNRYFSAPIAQRMRKQQSADTQSGRASDSPDSLTNREVEVIQMIADGLSNKEIAAAIGISVKTVEKHRQKAMNKLNIHEVAGLTRYALAKGLVEGQKNPTADQRV